MDTATARHRVRIYTAGSAFATDPMAEDCARGLADDYERLLNDNAAHGLVTFGAVQGPVRIRVAHISAIEVVEEQPPLTTIPPRSAPPRFRPSSPFGWETR